MNADSRVMEFFAERLSRGKSDALVDRAECQFGEHGFGPCAAEFRGDGSLIGFIGLSIPSLERLGMTHNPADDFDHPLLPEGHPLRRHVLYRLSLTGGKP